LSTFKAYLGEPHPCYRCLFREPPPPELAPSCSEGGVLGALAGMMGSFQAIEVLKEVLAIGDTLSGRLMIYDALGATIRNVRVKRDPACPLCGPQAVIRDLGRHAA
jgi:adenylyltransferase/sulfurtransferase